MELNREQIIKGLECCQKRKCQNCTYDVFGNPLSNCRVKKHALALIKELTEENERLSAENADWESIAEQYQKQFEDCYEEKERLERICHSYALQYGTATDKEVFLKKERADTVRKMQERLEKRIASAEYSAKTDRKTVKKEELIEQVNWVLHKVVPDTIDQIAKEMVEGTTDEG